MALPSDQLRVHPFWKEQQVKPVARGGQQSVFLGSCRTVEAVSPPPAW